MPSDKFEQINAGETASIENTKAKPLALSVTCDNGCEIKLELQPGQILSFSAGEANAELALHDGDASALRIIKPGAAT
jgi:hypothetical protein